MVNVEHRGEHDAVGVVGQRAVEQQFGGGAAAVGVIAGGDEAAMAFRRGGEFCAQVGERAAADAEHRMADQQQAGAGEFGAAVVEVGGAGLQRGVGLARRQRGAAGVEAAGDGDSARLSAFDRARQRGADVVARDFGRVGIVEGVNVDTVDAEPTAKTRRSNARSARRSAGCGGYG